MYIRANQCLYITMVSQFIDTFHMKTSKKTARLTSNRGNTSFIISPSL